MSLHLELYGVSLLFCNLKWLAGDMKSHHSCGSVVLQNRMTHKHHHLISVFTSQIYLIMIKCNCSVTSNSSVTPKIKQYFYAEVL